MTSVSERPVVEPAISARGARLIEQVRQLRVAGSAGRLDRWLLVIGGLLMPLGVALILLGWAGAAHTPILQEQVTYLISGGILGLALSVAGGFVYFAYWQTVRIRDSERQAQAVVTALGELKSLLRSEAVAGGAAATQSYVATPTGTIYHRPDCPVVDGRDDIRPVAARQQGLRPCKICTPETA